MKVFLLLLIAIPTYAQAPGNSIFVSPEERAKIIETMEDMVNTIEALKAALVTCRRVQSS